MDNKEERKDGNFDPVCGMTVTKENAGLQLRLQRKDLLLLRR